MPGLLPAHGRQSSGQNKGLPLQCFSGGRRLVSVHAYTKLTQLVYDILGLRLVEKFENSLGADLPKILLGHNRFFTCLLQSLHAAKVRSQHSSCLTPDIADAQTCQQPVQRVVTGYVNRRQQLIH